MALSEATMLDRALHTGVGAGVVRTLTGRTLLDRAAVLLMLVGVLAVAAYAWARPDYNWDMVAYVASALEDRHADPAELHARTWALIDAGASEAQQQHLKFSHPYNVNQWENPVDFQSQLSMYRVKIGYIGLLRALEPAFGLVNATFLLSVVPALGLGLFCLWWLWREGAAQGAFVVAPLLMLAGYTRMASGVSPDMLLALVSIAAIWALWRGRDGLGCALLFASVFVRPDSLILVFAVLIAAILFGWRKLPFAITFLAAFVVCIAISRVGNHPGWWAHFYFSCVQMQNSMAGFHPDFSLLDFASGYARGALNALQANAWPALLVLLTAGWALLNRYGRIGAGRANALVFAMAIGTLGKFASFPLPDDRFYFVFIAGMAMVLVAAWKPRFDERRA